MTVHGLFTDLPKFKDVRFTLTRHKSKKFPIRSINELSDIAIHHSLTRQGLSGSNAEGYARFHVNSHDWPGIGYSYVIEPDGTIKFANEIHHRTYHVGNSNNFSVGIVLSGDFRYEEPTAAQAESLRLLVARLQKAYPQLKRVRSHDEFPGYSWKACCEFNYRQILSQKVEQVKAQSLGEKYTVQEGDTFWSIAKGRNFEVIDLETVNPGVNPRELRIGQVISIPTKIKKATEQQKESPIYHGNSIVKYLDSIGEASSYEARKQLAIKYGISNYSGTAVQNIQLLGIIRDGKKAPSTLVATPNKTVKVGDTVTIPAGKLYGQGNAVNPSNNAKLTGKVERINDNWRNSIRLINSKGQYIGFARMSDVAGGAISSGKHFDVESIAQQIRKGVDNKGKSIPTGHEPRRKHFELTKDEYAKIRARVNQIM